MADSVHITWESPSANQNWLEPVRWISNYLDDIDMVCARTIKNSISIRCSVEAKG